MLSLILLVHIITHMSAAESEFLQRSGKQNFVLKGLDT